MVMIYYYVMLAISLLMVIVYAFIFHKHFDPNITIISILVPVLNLAFVFMGLSKTVEEAIIALKFTYIGGCFLIVSVMFLIFNVCGITIKSWQKALILAISTGVYATALTIGYSPIFYQSLPDIAFSNGAAYLTNKHYGPMHTVFYILIGIYYAISITAIVYSFFKKKQVPRISLILISLSVTIAIVGFFGGRLFQEKVEPLPMSYTLGMGLYLVMAIRLRLYDASDAVTDALVQKGDTGFVSFDSKLRYLGSNDTAKKMFPELNEAIIDYRIKNEWARDHFENWINEYKNNQDNNRFLIEKEDKTFLVNVNRLAHGHHYHGYQIFITDDTKNQTYIKLIKNYNSELESEVAKKTRSVIEMQDKLVLGMATMVEGRDNSTGGHIRRTSDVVRFLVEEMKKENELNLSDKFYNDLIKAAPMHDLGKITVDDAILRKPGKFTPEEYEIMKTHAPEGARIVSQILEGTDDKEFAKLATNVAHYHHEKWDGTGYPDHLAGAKIPLEARIMAIADVYDALVSKRVYKEKFTFEDANNIIIESMGKHFDKSLEKYYLQAREKIENYYIASGN